MAGQTKKILEKKEAVPKTEIVLDRKKRWEGQKKKVGGKKKNLAEILPL